MVADLLMYWILCVCLVSINVIDYCSFCLDCSQSVARFNADSIEMEETDIDFIPVDK